MTHLTEMIWVCSAGSDLFRMEFTREEFDTWRVGLAREAGYPVGVYTADPNPTFTWRGQLGHVPSDLYPYEDYVNFGFPWKDISINNLFGVWGSEPPDPLMVLLAHSNVRGVIPGVDTSSLLRRIDSLAASAKVGVFKHSLVNQQKTMQFSILLSFRAEILFESV